MPQYIYQHSSWPQFHWDHKQVSQPLAAARHAQGQLGGRLAALGFSQQAEANLQSLTEEVIKSSEIEGETLDRVQVRSSLAKRLGVEDASLPLVDRQVEAVVDLMLDATQNYQAPLTAERLWSWQAALFPTGRSGLSLVETGQWRSDVQGPMQVISGPLGRERVHFQAPAAMRLNQEMALFLAWFAQKQDLDAVIKAAIAHIWFVTIHPFADGNGRIARAITELQLARSESSPQRFYSMSAQIRQRRNEYYQILETTQRGDLDITAWLEWFLSCLQGALAQTETLLSAVLQKAAFWQTWGQSQVNERQRMMLNRLLDGFEGKLTSSKWAKLAKCSQDTASRDLVNLEERGLLRKGPAGGRSSSYDLVLPGKPNPRDSAS